LRPKCQHKSAWVLAHKIRQAIASETANATLSGEIEVDGMHTHVVLDLSETVADALRLIE
jgi:hypothetical protein